ncbi:hypothetical protein GV791_30410, partial [Nocardia cyriacigeorgica]|nr:hypothetical protein [Nocardia cyriacigeorgica]
MATSATLRISRLRALIEHPNTGDGERATAQRMLDRILTRTGTEPVVGDRTYGNRHHRVGRHADLHRIADMIRDDIVLARATFAPRPAHPGEPALR